MKKSLFLVIFMHMFFITCREDGLNIDNIGINITYSKIINNELSYSYELKNLSGYSFGSMEVKISYIFVDNDETYFKMDTHIQKIHPGDVIQQGNPENPVIIDLSEFDENTNPGFNI